MAFRERLAGALFPVTGAPLVAPDLHAVGLSVLGAFLVVHSLRALAFPGPSRWAGAVQFILGASLFLGARRISALWSALGSGEEGRGRESGVGSQVPTT